MRAVWIYTTLFIFVVGIVSAQPAANPLTFEVASVRPSAQDAHGWFINFLPGGGLRVIGAPLKSLITLAYDVRDFQVSGGPGWINSDRFDINARGEASEVTESAPADLTKMTEEQRMANAEQAKERLRNLLEERFKLAIHRENKEQQVYALIVAKGGPKIQESKEAAGRMRLGRGLLTGQSVNLAFLATNLSNQLGRPVIDKTALTGKYDFELKWTPDPGQPAAAPFGPPAPGVELPPPPDPNGPSIFTALQEQLGLRLESQKGPVDTLVIDRVERPSEN
jgi:bla regulator protein blaR1